ncbi:MAG: flavodoxin family protein [Methanospirillum sp.]|nr:flavodoxin family protein [Methanospirillum sp.]
MPLILGLLGSPLPHGNTALLLDRALAGAAEAGCAVERVNVPLLTFEPCMEILHCMTAPECAQFDDLTQFYAKVVAADGIVIATPVMTMGMPGKLKGFLDRFQVFYWAKYGRREPLVPKERRSQRHGLLLAISGLPRGTEPRVFDGVLNSTRAWFDIVDVTAGEELLIDHMDEKRDLAGFPALLEEARAMGQRLGTRACEGRRAPPGG